MTITQLEYVIAVDNHRHFGRAAESCHVTQPTLSMQINKLEEDLGVKLFDRDKKPIEPTAVGRRIIDQARIIVAEGGRLRQLAQEARSSYEGDLRLGIIPTIAPYLLPRILDRFRSRFPDVHLIIEEAQTDTIVQKLKLDQLDAGILATPLEDKAIIEEPVYYEPFMAFIPEGHRLDGEKFITNSELSTRDMLLLNEGHCFRNSVLNLCAETDPQNDRSRVSLESGNFETLIRLSMKGYGMTLLPYLGALDLPDRLQQFVRPIADPKPSREVSVIFSKNQVKVGLIRGLGEVIRNSVPPKLLEPGKVVSPLRQ